MATEQKILDESFPAAEDLSDYQYHFVILTTSGTVRLPDSGVECPLGILQNAPESGKAASVRLIGKSKLVANAVLAIGTFVKPEYVGPTDAGKAQDATGYEGYARAFVVEASAAEDDLCSVIILPGRPPGTYAVTELTLADGKVIIGDGGAAGRAVTPTGDVTVNNSGVTAIGAVKVLTAMISNAQVTDSKISVGNGAIVIGDGSGVGRSAALSGDVTMNNSGAVAIGNGKITETMLASVNLSGLISYAKSFLTSHVTSNSH